MPKKEEPVAGADDEGFEAVKKGAAPEEVKPKAAPKPAAKAKAGFSFAAAAGALGDEGDDDEEVDEVAEKVKDVSV